MAATPPRFSALECKVCYLAYSENGGPKTPVNLPSCGHTVCVYCATEVWRNGDRETLVCPMCRVSNVVRTVKDLGRNFVALEIIRQLREESGHPAPAPEHFSPPPAAPFRYSLMDMPALQPFAINGRVDFANFLLDGILPHRSQRPAAQMPVLERFVVQPPREPRRETSENEQEQ